MRWHSVAIGLLSDWPRNCRDHIASMFAAIESFVSWFSSVGYFIVFWICTLIAFVSPRRRAKQAFLIFFFVSMATVGLVIGSPVWPFHQWHLWARILPRTLDYYELWLEDERGHQLIYDLRAVPPMNPAYANRAYAPRMLQAARRSEADGMVNWLLAKANDHRPSPSLFECLRFPERELSHYQCAGLYENRRVFPEWPADHGEFVTLVIKKKRALFPRSSGSEAEFTLLEETRLP